MPVNPMLRRYRERYAEPGSAHLATGTQGRQFKQVLVIVCFAEADDFLDAMNIPGGMDTLSVVVVNSPDNANAEDRRRTLACLAALLARPAPNRLIVDRVNDPIPHRQGVGLARKIGADIAVELIDRDIVHTPWIYFTDADARLPADYFQTPLPAAGTLLFGYRHEAGDDELQRRADLYELHLRYYTWQLRRSGSSYGFSSLGSLLSVSAQAYAAVRGVPKRNAAEDFYLLNKLAKVAPVTQLIRPVVRLAARMSTRVPFGTGPALNTMPTASEDYLSYAPEAFDSLSNTLTALTRYAECGELALTDSQAFASLETLGWRRFEAQLQRITALRQRRRQIREWFDGFRTMRFVRLAAAEYPDQPLLATLRKLLSAEPGAPAETLLGRLIEDERSVTIWPDDH